MLAARLVDVEYDVALKITEDFGGQQVVEVSQTCWFFHVILHFSVRINCDGNMFSEKNGERGLVFWGDNISLSGLAVYLTHRCYAKKPTPP